MTTAKVTCPMCHGEGTLDNPPVFHNEGESAFIPGTNCESCDGTGYIELNNPAGIRAAVLVAKKIRSLYPNVPKWEDVYCVIVSNISNAVNISDTSAMWNQQHTEDPFFDDDVIFSDDSLPIDARLHILIERNNFIGEAKTILGLT